MEITKKLVTNLMENLICVAISANGGISLDKNGEPYISQENLDLCKEYAERVSQNILSEWEELMNNKWEVID